VGTSESVAHFDFRSGVEEIQTAPAQQPAIILKANSPMSETVDLPTVQVLGQGRLCLLSCGGYAGDKPHDLGIGTNLEKIIKVT
jgi:hypothetical protein